MKPKQNQPAALASRL